MLTELKYSVKSFRSVLSGFDCWEQQVSPGEFEEVEIGLYDDYYTCARYKNGRHIPLPILDDWEPEENKLQKMAIGAAATISDVWRKCRRFYINIGGNFEFALFDWDFGRGDYALYLGPITIWYR